MGQEAPARMEAGLPIGYFRGYQTDGVFQTQEEVDAHALKAMRNQETYDLEIPTEMVLSQTMTKPTLEILSQMQPLV